MALALGLSGYREAPKSYVVSFLFAARRLLGIANFALALTLLAHKLFLFFANPKSASFSATLLDARDVILKKACSFDEHCRSGSF
ncbi:MULTISPECIES: hypothetical protein [unclassified Bradyrhizobium]